MYFRPTPYGIVSLPFILALTNSSIDSLFGEFSFYDVSWTLIGVLDIFLVLFFFFSVLRVSVDFFSLFSFFSLISVSMFVYFYFSDPSSLIFYWMYLKIFLVYIVFLDVFRRVKRSRPFDVIMSWCLVSLFLLMCTFYYFSSVGRLSFPHLNQNVLSNFLVLALMLIVGVQFVFGVSKYFKYFVILVTIFVVALTQSRMGLLLLMFVFLYSEFRIFGIKRLTFLILPVLFVSFFLFYDYFLRFLDFLVFFQTFDVNSVDTLRSRLVLWAVNYSYFVDHFYFGYGPGRYIIDSEYGYQMGSLLGHGYVAVTAHNDFLQVSSGFGLLFSLIFFSFVYYKLRLAGTVFMLLFSVMMVFNSNLETSRFLFLLGVYLAFIYTFFNRNRGKAQDGLD